MRDGLRLPYAAVRRPGGRLALRPHVPLRLTTLDRAADVEGLVDSGADVSVLPFAIGVQLGFDWDHQRVAVALGGNLARSEARVVVVSAVVGQFAPVDLVFAWTRAEHVPLVLGQANFFAEFDVCFFRSQGLIEVRPKGAT